VDFIYHGEVEVEKENLYDFLAIGEKLKLKGLAKTPEHSAQQVDQEEDGSHHVQKLDSRDNSIIKEYIKNPYAVAPLKRPWDGQRAPRATRNAYQSNGDSMIDKNGDVWSCIVCGKIAADPKTKANLKRHTETHIKGIPWPCDICGKVSGSKSGLAQHRSKYHKGHEDMLEQGPLEARIPDDCMINSMIEKNGELWTCTRCGKTANDARQKANLRRHIEVHIDGVAYNCDICGKQSGSKNGLSQHKSKYHRSMGLDQGHDQGHFSISQEHNVPIMPDPSHIPEITHTNLSP